MPSIKKSITNKTPVAVKIKSSDGLPTTLTQSAGTLEECKTLIVAPPGWGKTELAMSNPDCLLLAFEEGHRFVTGYKMIIDAWDETDEWTEKDGTIHCSMLQACKKLEKSSRFQYVFLDTVDAMVKMLLDFKLPQKKAEHASDLGDYGKGWDIAQNTPFRQVLNRIMKTGRGILAATHEATEQKNFKGMGQRAKKETTLPSGIQRQIYAQFEMIGHGIYGKIDKKTRIRERILQFEGSSDILAKNRGGKMPAGFVVPRKFEDRWTKFARLFDNKAEHEKALKELEEKGYELE